MSQVGRYSQRMTGGRPPALASVENGRIPLSSLGRCVTQTQAEHPYLYAPAARALDAMARDAAKDGVKIQAVALYRDFDGQVRMKRIWTARGKPQNAATPGTSSHGWGTAGDLNSKGPGVLNWLVKNATKYGWDHPLWAGGPAGPQAGPEPWHWQFIQGFTLESEIPVFIVDRRVEEADAYMASGKIMVALRPMAEELNAEITAFDGAKMFVDGDGSQQGWLTAVIKNGRGFVPARALAELLGVSIQWDGKTLRLG